MTRQPAEAGEYVALTVRDNGHGMDAATKARVFDPFFTTKFTGRGLGLSAVLGIVRGHKGLLTLESAPGAGTTFRVYFPASGARSAEEAPSRVPVERGADTVLVVDDEEVVRTTARIALSRSGYDVLLAQDGEEAVRLVHERNGQIDVVLLDMTMPVMGGEEALRRIREIRPDAVVLATSGFDEQEAQRRFGDRIAGFLQKPYTVAQLTGKVGHVLRK